MFLSGWKAIAEHLIIGDPMRLLCDENIPTSIVERLRVRGHDVLWINDGRHGIRDDEVCRLARSEARTLVTFDKDFRTWALRTAESLPDGVILLQIESRDYDFACDRAIQAIQSRADWRGVLAVVMDKRTSVRHLKPDAPD